MARIDVKANVTAPSQINIPLVRADVHGMSNVFRIFFEAFLACFSGFLGAVMAMPEAAAVYWVVVVIFGLFAAVSGICSYGYAKSSRWGSGE